MLLLINRDIAGMFRSIHGRVIAAGLVVCLAIGPLSAAPTDWEFRNGLSAYNSGNYLKALEIWLPLAQHEDAPSQAGVGFIYHRGLGVEVDDEKAFFWSRKAAEHGQPEGQMMLGTLYFYGQGVGRSYVQAYAWCDLAQDAGSADAEDCRGAALQSLHSDRELKQAFQLSNDLHRRFGPRR
jgi:TPR repeat protein